MSFTPQNEQGVIVIFSQAIARLDNISIIEIRAKYPDAILLVNSREVRVEFEYLSSNFVDHSHDPRECDLIICWKDDIQHKNTLPAWEMSNEKWKSLYINFISHVQKEAFYWEIRARKAENLLRTRQNDIQQANGQFLLKQEIVRNPNPNITHLAERLNVSRTTIYNWIETLVDSGQMIKNSNGYEVNGSVQR